MSYQGWENSFIRKSEAVKSAIYGPIVAVLAWAKVKPAWVTHSKILLMVAFVFLVKDYPLWALLLLLLDSLFLDCVDGSLARKQGTASDKGKFSDATMDYLAFFLFLVGITYAGLVPGLVAVILGAATAFATALAVIKRSLKIRSDWHFRTQSGMHVATLRFLVYLFFLIYAIWKINLLPEVAAVFCALLAAQALWDYVAILKTPPTKGLS